MRHTVLILSLLLTLFTAGIAVEPTTCSTCQGSGKCQVCEGDGLRQDGSTCSYCSGTKKCYFCSGVGKS